MADFERAFQKVMANEGGWVNNPVDRGGETYKGVARKVWATWAAWPLIDRLKKPLGKQPAYGTKDYWKYAKRVDEILGSNNAVQGMVRELYETNFWRRLGEMDDQRVAEEVFDKAVNCGVGTAVKWLQHALNATADGALGKQTVSLANAADPVKLLDAFNQQARKHYDAIVANHPDQRRFYKAWIGRLKNYDGSQFA